jgi:hypothetical protein
VEITSSSPEDDGDAMNRKFLRLRKEKGLPLAQVPEICKI